MDQQKIRVGIVGASGYTGMELVRLLLNHPKVELVAVTSRQESGKSLKEVFPRFHGYHGSEIQFIEPNVDEMIKLGVQVAFLALPHGVAAEVAVPLLAQGVKIIDLSADFRLRDASIYQEFYGHAHPAPELLAEAVYGLPEIRSAQIRAARLIASPGCYPTSILLPLLPLLQKRLLKIDTIVVNSLSGVSGAGKKADLSLLYCECNESVRAYGLPKHRHLSEIEQELSIAAEETVQLTFIPHLAPMHSGILTTTTVSLQQGVTADAIHQALQTAYQDAFFVRYLGRNQSVDVKHVVKSNFIDISWEIDSRTNRLILMSAEDNLIKGASGQAIQSFNVMHDFAESTGLL